MALSILDRSAIPEHGREQKNTAALSRRNNLFKLKHSSVKVISNLSPANCQSYSNSFNSQNQQCLEFCYEKTNSKS